MVKDLWPDRPIFTADHHDYRRTVAEWVKRDVVPFQLEWERDEIIPREPWLSAGKQGLLGNGVAEADGGPGIDDHVYRLVFAEEMARVGASSLASGMGAHNDIVLPYLIDLATPEQKRRWLPGMCAGELIGAVGMTEPGTGSDLQSIRTSAVLDGDEWVINGAKTFITNGINGDVVLLVCRTDPDAGSQGFSLIVVERDAPGFARGRNLDKIGMHGQDTAELSFTDCRVPKDNLVGERGQGLRYLMSHLPLERMGIALAACGGIRAALTWTLDYTTTRTAFGTPIAGFQNTQFALAEMVTELEFAQAWTDDALRRLNAGTLDAVDAAKGKWFTTELHKRVVDRCLQFFGGYGFMAEYPIARAYDDVRVSTIYGGTTEIMKVIIARDLIGRLDRPRPGA